MKIGIIETLLTTLPLQKIRFDQTHEKFSELYSWANTIHLAYMVYLPTNSKTNRPRKVMAVHCKRFEGVQYWVDWSGRAFVIG